MFQTNGIIGKNFQAMKYLQIFSKQWIFTKNRYKLLLSQKRIYTSRKGVLVFAEIFAQTFTFRFFLTQMPERVSQKKIGENKSAPFVSKL